MAALTQVLMLLALWTSFSWEAMAFPTGLAGPCRRSSPSLDDCVREGLVRLIQHFKTGDVELGVPPLEPLEIPLLELRSDEQTNLTLELVMRDILVRGLTDIIFAKVSTNLEDVNKLEVTGKIPALHMSGQYHSEGLLVNFPLHSSGSFLVNMTEVTSSWVVYLQEETRANVSYLQVAGLDVEMMPISITFSPVAQLDDDNRLGEAVNIILKENSHEIYSIIKGRLSAVLSDVLTELANEALRQIPESVYLEPSSISSISGH